MLPIASCHISWNWWSAWLFGWFVGRFAAQSYRSQTGVCGLARLQAANQLTTSHAPGFDRQHSA